MRQAWFVPALALATVSTTAAQSPGKLDPLAGLDAYVERVRTEWKIPGLAVGIVKDDSLIYAKGFGVKELGKPGAVTPRTVFAVGSNTKSFTATAAAMLADDGTIKWDDKVTRWLPSFQLYDPYVTREINLRDVLSHRSGLGRRGDALWYGTTYSRAEILRRIRYLKPNAPFRTEMGYQNVMFLAAGEALGAAAGMSYDDLIRRRIFAPLGMTTSTMSVKELTGLPDVSTPHSIETAGVKVIPWRDIDNIAPAGSINSNVEEMARYLRLHLGNGTYAGKRLVSATNLGVTKTPHINVGGPGDSLTHFSAYGLGWVLQDYRGKKIAWHNGGIDGMLSEMWTIPEAGLGIVVLSNGSPHSAGPAVVWEVIDRYLLGKAAKDYLGQGLKMYATMMTAQEQKTKQDEEKRAKDSKPSLPLEQFAGTYTDSLYGDISIRLSNGALALQFQSTTVSLTHWQFNTFRGGSAGLGVIGLATFQLDQTGKAVALEVEGLGTFRR